MPPREIFHEDDITVRFRGMAGVRNDRHSAASAASEPVFTWQEVAKHNHVGSNWVSVRGKVYDITGWIDSHPGGRESLLLAAGRDITYAFDSYHPFTDKPEQVLRKFHIGKVVNYEFPQYRPDSGFYRALRDRVGHYFRVNRLNPKNPVPGLWRMSMVFVVAVFSFLAGNGFWPQVGSLSQLLAALVFGVCQALPLLHVMHDSSHLAFGTSERWWQITGRLAMDWFAGANMTSWHNQHVIGHHIYTNVFACDPDLPNRPAGDPRRLVSHQTWHSIYRWQHLYLPPLYGLLGIKFRFQDILETYGSSQNGPVRVNPISLLQWVEMLGTKVCWASWRIVIPLVHSAFHIGPGYFWALFFLSEFVTGYFLAFNFQVSHVSTLCDYPSGEVEKNALQRGQIPDEWAISQVNSSVDYAHGNAITTFLCGALNYQVTHHLFPSVSQYHYPAIAPIIMEVCKEYGVHYRVLPDFASALKAHVDHLRVMGARAEPAEIHMG